MVVYNTDYPDKKTIFDLKHAHTPIPVNGGPRALLRANGVVVVEDHIPVNPIPPALEVLVLSGNTIVHHPCVLPGVDAENGLDVDGAGGKALLVLGVGAHGSSELVAQLRLGGVGGHIDRLPPGVGGWVGRAGAVGAENVHQAFALEVFSEPHEAGAEHCACCRQEIQLQGLDGGARVDDVFGESVGNGGGCGGLYGGS